MEDKSSTGDDDVITNGHRTSGRSTSVPHKSKPPLPVDRGWAWMVMFGAFMNIFMLMIFIRSTALLFIYFLDTYKESATMTTLAMGLSSAMFAISNILGPTIFLPRFKVRTLVLMGATVNFFCILAIAFAPNMIVIDILMAILGFSHGFITVPQMILVGHYFKKRLSFATACVNLGLSAATMAGPPLTQFLIDEYGLQGAILILSALNGNCIAASLLLRPVSMYAPPDTVTDPITHEDAAYREAGKPTKFSPRLQIYRPGDIRTEEEVASLTHDREEGKLTGNKLNVIPSKTQRAPRTRSVSENFHTERVISVGPPGEGRRPAYAQSDMNIQTLASKASSHSHSLASELIDAISMSSSIRYISDPHFLSTTSVARGSIQNSKLDLPLALRKLSANSTAKEVENCVLNTPCKEDKITCFQKMLRSVSSSIYIHPLGLLLLLSSGLGIHSQACISYMPSMGKENGLADHQIPLLVTVIGISDLVSKLSIGFFADLGLVKRFHIPIVTQLFLGTVLQFVHFFQGFGLMMLLQILVGFTVGVLHVMLPVITVDTLGLQHMGHIIGGYFLINGISTSVDHVIVGSLKDMTDSFLGAYHYMGALILLTAVMLMLEPLVARLKPPPRL